MPASPIASETTLLASPLSRTPSTEAFLIGGAKPVLTRFEGSFVPNTSSCSGSGSLRLRGAIFTRGTRVNLRGEMFGRGGLGEWWGEVSRGGERGA
jgi:hypothetical protein